MQYVRKTTAIEAEQFDPGIKPWPAGVTHCRGYGYRITNRLKDWLPLMPGDWLITNEYGIIYPLSEDTFHKIYEEKLDE